MKPLNHNNLGVILTFGVPTTVALLGLFWLLRRKKDGDDDDGNVARTAKVKPLIGDASEKKKDLAEKALLDGGDSAVRKREHVKEEKEAITEQHRKQVSGYENKSELQLDLSSLNSRRSESVTTTVQSDQILSVLRSPAVGEMVAASSPVTSHDILQPSVMSSVVTSSIGSAAKSCDYSDQSLQSQWSLLGEAETTVIVETSTVEELTMMVTSNGNSASTATQPSSSQCSLLSDSSGNVLDSKETGGEVTSAECFSRSQSSGVCSLSDSFAVIGHSISNPFAVEEIVPANVSQICHAPRSSNALPGLTSNQSSNSLPEEAKVAKSEEESESPIKDNKATLQPASKLEQTADHCQTSESAQPVVDISESKLPSEEADVIVEEECSNVCKTAESKSIPGDIGASAPMPNLTTANVEAVESKSVYQEPASASEQGHGTTGTKQNTPSSESRATEQHDIVGNQDYSLEEESNKSSSSVILPASSTNSNANCSASSSDTDKASPKKDRSSVSVKKTDSKDTPKTSPNQKNASPQSKSAGPHSKSASPSKAKQSTPPKPANSHSSRNKNHPTPREGTSECEAASKATSGVAENGRVDSGSPICDTNSEVAGLPKTPCASLPGNATTALPKTILQGTVKASNDSGRGGSVGDTLIPSGGDLVLYDFNFPSELCGRLIGRGGKNIQHIKDQSGATVTLSSNPFTPEFQICHVRGLQVDVDRALLTIRKKFPLAHYPRLDMAPLTPPAPAAPVVLPEVMQLSLPEGVSIDVVVSAVVNAGHIFIQQPTHPSFPSLERLNQVMNTCYGDPNTPSLPRPVDAGSICVSESESLWFRTQVVQVYPAEDECDIKYVDYGGYNRVPINTLKQIRSDFMTLPFQAVECYLANVTPLQEEEYFSEKAAEVLMELTSGQMLQGQVVGRGEDNIGYVHLYRVSGNKVLMINREMVNREVVRWIEIL